MNDISYFKGDYLSGFIVQVVGVQHHIALTVHPKQTGIGGITVAAWYFIGCL